jgi:FMN phosphatase YigB (HAD superfamily)
MIKHVSLDFWNTMAHPNPEFAHLRNSVLATLLRRSHEDVRLAYRKVKDAADADAERGVHPTKDGIYAQFLGELGVDPSLADHVAKTLELCFIKNKPLIDPEILENLVSLSMRGVTFSIASNVNFIDGPTIVKAKDLRIKPAEARKANPMMSPVFEFAVFSCAAGFSKPNPLFWQCVLDSVPFGVRSRDVLHIGDNAICDGSCENHGIQFRKVSCPSETADVLSGLVSVLEQRRIA